MQTSKWGPHGWEFLHTIAHNYTYNKDEIDDEDIEDYYKFFYYLGKVLPCKYCRNSYQQFFKELPLEPFLENQELAHWMYLMHNKVNDKLRNQGENKPPNPPYENVYRHYDSYRAKSCTERKEKKNEVVTKHIYCKAPRPYIPSKYQ